MLPSFLLLLLSSTLLPFISTATTLHRRILHQPFFPQDSFPPSQPPIPSPPSYPFSNSTPNNNTPFFPSYPSPPAPPSPTSTATTSTFPANVSSLAVPHPPKSKSSSKLIITAAATVSAAAAVILLALFLHLRKQRSSSPPQSSSTKTQRSDSSTTNSTRIPKLQRPSQTSSEFLYLGTLVNSHAATNNGIAYLNNHRNNGSVSSDSRKLDSPELRPLPPLIAQHQLQSYRSADVLSSKDDEEEFYSPRDGSSSFGSESDSRRAFTYVAVQLDNFNRSTSNSSSIYSSSVSGSGSGSPIQSVSVSLSPTNSASPRNTIPNSPDLIEIQTIRPLHQRTSLQRNPVFKESLSPSPPSSSSPERDSRVSEESSLRISNLESPVRISSPVQHKPIVIPTPPPPPPLAKRTSPPRPGALITPLKSIPVENPTLISPINLQESPVRISSPVHHKPIVIPTPPPLAKRTSPPGPGALITPLKSIPVENPTLISPINLQESPVRISSPVQHKPIVIPTPPPLAKMTSPPRPGALITPLKSIPVENLTLISPINLQEFSANGSESSTQEKEYERHEEETTPKPKLKPLHWDKVRASSDREMVWDQLKCSSFKVNEEMIETLFVVNTPKPSPKEATRWQVLPSPGGDNGIRVLDPKKAQNIAILLRAFNVTVDEVCEGLLEGNSDSLGTELLESLLKMAPSKEEERKLKEYKDESPVVKLGAAEKFLMTVLDIPYAFKRVDAMLYISNFDSEVEYLKRSFETLEAACEELRTSRMFLKLLEAVLKTGNRMNVGTNRGDAHAFKLDTLLKLVDVKGVDGKTTLLHFVVQEIIKTEGARLSNQNKNPSINIDDRKLGLQVVSSLSSELCNVKKAAAMDAEVLSSDVSKLSKGISDIGEVARLNETTFLDENESGEFSDSMKLFTKKSEEVIIKVQAQESVALSLVKEITEYFHGNSIKEEAHPFRIFLVVRDFLTVLDRVCKEVGMINERTIVSSAHKFPVPINPMLQPVSGVVQFRKQNSSFDESSSSS